MARTPGSDAILGAAAQWRDTCLLAEGSIFGEASVWTRDHLVEIEEHFVMRPDTGNRTFLEKLKDQLVPASTGAKQLTAEMLWVMMLFPSNVSFDRKVETVTQVWGWSGETLSREHPMLAVLRHGIGSGGMGYNSYRAVELQLFDRIMLAWKTLTLDARSALAADPWAFAEFIDSVEGAERRQFRHMLLYLLFPDTFERSASGSTKELIDNAFRDRFIALHRNEREEGNTLVARDRRLLRIRHSIEAEQPGEPIDFFEGNLYAQWDRAGTAPASDRANTDGICTGIGPDAVDPTEEPVVVHTEGDLSAVTKALHEQGLRIEERMIRRYHLALRSHGFVVLAGVSGTGKTWLAEAYAKTVGARELLVAVAPNWTTNEDLLGYLDPISGQYRDTEFSRFLRECAAEYVEARRAGRAPREFHLILDEMNLARVEHYFAKFLSAMEQRMRDGEVHIELSAGNTVILNSNLRFIGTVNVDETTHGFADKVYDRAQLIELVVPRDAIALHLGSAPYADVILDVWDAVASVAPFAFRVVDDMRRYIDGAAGLGVPWEDLIDELLLQKVLPKIRGTNPRVGDALEAFGTITGPFALTHAEVLAMRAGFDQHGVASFF